MQKKCILFLSNGGLFTGKLIGAPISASGELVFTTGMVGYSEAMTDPSYFGQILIFAYPLIGNYGIPQLSVGSNDAIPKGFESEKIHAAAVIMTVDSPEAYHWNSFQSLDAWLKKENVPGVVGLDTRHLIHLIRSEKNLLGFVEPREQGDDTSQKAFFNPSETDILQHVSSKNRRLIGRGKTRIALIDCGVKWNIIRQLLALDCEIELLPWTTDLKTVDCDGWLLSNGPGDPGRTGDLKDQISETLLKDKRPVLGICLGHQLLALAAGGATKKMSYGHRSHNQPVAEVNTRRGYITSQNHGFVVDQETLSEDWEPWFLNANDGTIEGMKHRSKPFCSVQFHPEAAGGPRDTGWIIDQFMVKVSSKIRTYPCL